MADNETFQQALALVQEDVVAGIGEIFEPRAEGGAAFAPGPPFDGDVEVQSDSVVAVPWKYECRHVGEVYDDGDEHERAPNLFAGLFPTGKALTIHGVTFVDRSGTEPRFYRYVDWAGVYSQLGLTVSRRVLLNDPEYRDGLEKVRERIRREIGES